VWEEITVSAVFALSCKTFFEPAGLWKFYFLHPFFAPIEFILKNIVAISFLR
jgi:hypothetical protein